MRLAAVLPLLLLACSGKGDDSSPDGPAADCPTKGALSGCLVYEGTDCTTNSALDGLPGGWFNDAGGQLSIGLARTTEGLDITLEVPNAAGLNDGSEYAIPTEVLVELWDRSGGEDVLYYACNGTLRVTNYTAGELIWATMTFQARGPMGVCGETDYWIVGAELVNAEFCAL